jgi:hypothetical protein
MTNDRHHPDMRDPFWAFALLPSQAHYPPKVRKRRQVLPVVKRARSREKVMMGKHITIATIATELGRSPRDCRAALRALAIKKPEHGWAWPPSEAAVISQRLKKKFAGKPTHH